MLQLRCNATGLFVLYGIALHKLHGEGTDTHTDTQTDKQTDGHCNSMTESTQWADSVKIFFLGKKI